MNIALVLQHKLMLGIRSLLSGAPSPATHATLWSTGPARPVQVQYKSVQHNREVQAASASNPIARKVMPLRVLRVVEKGQPRSCAGRLVISGRMVDVCAELDRLVAREAALH
jgi:hypothetical protein